ncbi:hypothetical protein BDC45DRAFT_441607, partial [Circinella umbellata]
ESELDCMEDGYSILKIIFRGKKYHFRMGEQACFGSKVVKEYNEANYSIGGIISATHNVMGRNIDLLVSSYELRISSCEWKAENVTPASIRKTRMVKIWVSQKKRCTFSNVHLFLMTL